MNPVTINNLTFTVTPGVTADRDPGWNRQDSGIYSRRESRTEHNLYRDNDYRGSGPAGQPAAGELYLEFHDRDIGLSSTRTVGIGRGIRSSGWFHGDEHRAHHHQWRRSGAEPGNRSNRVPARIPGPPRGHARDESDRSAGKLDWSRPTSTPPDSRTCGSARRSERSDFHSRPVQDLEHSDVVGRQRDP